MPRPPAFNSDTALSAALETFWRSGYNGSSIQVLLDAMGLNRGSLYNSFGDKQTLFRKAIDHYYQHVTRLVVALLEQSPNPVQGMVAVFELSLIDLPDLEIQKGCLLVNTVSELSDTEPELARHALRLLQEVREAFAHALQRAADSGQWSNPDADPWQAAELLFNFLTGLRVTARFDIDREEIRATVFRTLRMLGLTL
jgi:TetR/AcrR family transcriptional regulator, transcriptional repressor for nem operon